jgi:hypothetical protein
MTTVPSRAPHRPARTLRAVPDTAGEPTRDQQRDLFADSLRAENRKRGKPYSEPTIDAYQWTHPKRNSYGRQEAHPPVLAPDLIAALLKVTSGKTFEDRRPRTHPGPTPRPAPDRGHRHMGRAPKPHLDHSHVRRDRPEGSAEPSHRPR